MVRPLFLAALLTSACSPRERGPASPPPGDYEPGRENEDLPLPRDRAAGLRNDAFARARVWREPATPVGEADLRANPPGAGSFAPDAEIVCKFLLRASGGQTPKFRCVLPTGEVIKVKYGRRNPEPVAEVAATRLLTALGFGADRTYRVARVRCFGCPPYPQAHFPWLDSFFSREGRYVDIAPATVERPFPGRRIASPGADGWGFYELEHFDPARGGATRAEVDALRLMAVFLADWDNKPRNQRLICLPGGEDPAGGCRMPFAYLQDVGATFGPVAVSLDAWRQFPMWADRPTCQVSMKSLPFNGATFVDVDLTEGGRRLLAAQMTQLRDAQVRDLFEAAGFAQYTRGPESNRDLDGWVGAFKAKVAEVADGPPCPTP
jgi:hypothetical protein